MSKRKTVFSGVFVISILVKHFGFSVVSQKGSHVKLRGGLRGIKTTIVPLHKELALGTLGNVLMLAGIDKPEFLRAVTRK